MGIATLDPFAFRPGQPQLSSLYEFTMSPSGPWVVAERVANTVGEGGVVIKQEDIDGTRIGIGEVDFAEDLERLRCDLVRIWCQSVSDFESVLIGLMLIVTADGAPHRI